MIVPVHMFAFHNTRDVIRNVEINDSYQHCAMVVEILNKVYEMGQNDFQPQHLPSVSVGDIIELEARQHKYWLIAPVGFSALTQKEFDSAVPPLGWTSYKNS